MVLVTLSPCPTFPGGEKRLAPSCYYLDRRLCAKSWHGQKVARHFTLSLQNLGTAKKCMDMGAREKSKQLILTLLTVIARRNMVMIVDCLMLLFSSICPLIKFSPILFSLSSFPLQMINNHLNYFLNRPIHLLNNNSRSK